MNETIIDLLKAGNWHNAGELAQQLDQDEKATLYGEVYKACGEKTIQLFSKWMADRESAKWVMHHLHAGNWNQAAEVMEGLTKAEQDVVYAHIVVKIGTNSVRMLSGKISERDYQRRMKAATEAAVKIKTKKDAILGKTIAAYENTVEMFRLTMTDGTQFTLRMKSDYEGYDNSILYEGQDGDFPA